MTKFNLNRLLTCAALVLLSSLTASGVETLIKRDAMTANVLSASATEVAAVVGSANTVTMGTASSTTGSIVLAGLTSGSLKLTTANATGQIVTVSAAAQTAGATTLTLPDMAGSSDTFVFLAKAQTLTNKTFTTPILGTPTSGTLTNCTGLPISTGVSGLGTGIATFLATPTSANLISAVTNETGSGVLVFATSPTLVTPILGTPTSGTLTSCTGLPVSTGISGLGTSVATALAVNIGSAGAPVLFNGALGTPSSGTLTNCTGLAFAALPTGTASNYQRTRRQYGANVSTTSSTYQLATGAAGDLTVSITPNSSVSIIRVRVTGGASNASGARMVVTLKRNIGGGGDTDLTPGGMEGLESIKAAAGTIVPHAIEFDDLPSTTTATVYKVFFASVDNSSTVYFHNWAGAFVPVTIAVEEIKQ